LVSLLDFEAPAATEDTMRPLSNATCTQSLWLRQKGKACRCPAPKRRSNRCLMRPACHLFGLASGLPACL